MDNETHDSGDSQNDDDETRDSEQPKARPVALEELAKALADGSDTDDGADDPGDSQDNAGEGGSDSLEPPKSLAEAAERLGMEKAEFYKLTVPDPHNEGDSFTLGQLQHQFEERSQFAVDQLAWEKTRGEQQAKLAEANEEVEELLRHLPEKSIKPEAFEAVRKLLNKRAERERAKTLEVIPEWGNGERATAELEQMVKFMQGQGFDAKYLQSVKDHRMMRFVRNAWLLQKRVDDALALVEKKGTSSGKPANSGKRSAQPAGKPQRNRPGDKRQQMVDLLQPTEG